MNSPLPQHAPRFSLTSVTGQLKQHQPRKILWRQRMTRAAVAIILANRIIDDALTPQPCLLMIRRAQHERDPWSGHMAFPGGRMEDFDATIQATAERETLEEIGLELNAAERVAPLSDVITRRHDKIRPMVVSPWVYQIDRETAWKMNYEVDEVVWIPLAFFADTNNRTVMHWRKLGMNMKLPCYYYADRKVWGLSLMMINELIQVANRP